MTQINPHYLKLRSGYLFPEIGRRVREFATKNPEAKLVRLGIGDVVLPLPQAVREAIKRAVDEMGQAEGFHGYGPEQGYEFLRDTIVTNDFEARGSDIQADEIFISDGSKCDTGNIQEIFDTKSIVAVTDPVYPVYVDTNVMAGRTGTAAKNGHYRGLVYLPLNAGNNFAPEMPHERVDLVYLCSPNNPTGTAMTRAALEQWVRYAKKVKAILLFDAAYEAFITEPDIPHSIFEIEGAREVAIEFRSFSKNAGFTGTRCAYTVVPKDLFAFDRKNEVVSLHHLWMRRHTTKFNGVAYPIQRGAEAVYSEAGKKEVRDLVSYYLANAAIACEGLRKAGLQVYGGVNAPYVWVKTPGKFTSWDFFDWLLKETNVVVTPGSGFGPTGEGYFRVSAFGFRENIEEALRRIQSKLPLA